MVSAKAKSGTRGASTASTAARPAVKTRMPANAESPASSRIELITKDVSETPPARRSQTILASGVQIPPGMYLASIDAISAWSAIPYETRIRNAARSHHQPTAKRR